ncbi:TetR family transcriptional regulator [Nonomuraea phyllanthi]|uniref:TetR/AcrR family transcriptional regulator n=1 Tax=Nonomuraea phyllanthi TaxID=2219224 RepID=UPI001292EEDE|nr:TetR/AcrR family transcriptional regulator [Nonomuraea phyllanthi]QFY10205.1 TetR family transcriptional regulator [Nonomuraea phyllanthi]
MTIEGKRRRGRPRKDEEQDTRRLLLDAALELFAAKGYAGTSVREIAKHANVHDSAIYFHFANKDAMYAALFEEMGPPSLEALCPDLDVLTAMAPADAIRSLAWQLFRVWSSPRGRQFAGVVLRDGSGQEGAQGLADAIEAAKRRLAQPFEAWQAAGLLRADQSAEQLVWELMAPLDVIWFMRLRPDACDEEIAAAERLVQAHLDYFLACAEIKEERS